MLQEVEVKNFLMCGKDLQRRRNNLELELRVFFHNEASSEISTLKFSRLSMNGSN